MNDRKRKVCFLTIIILNFSMILIYNTLTPYMSDDLWYKPGVMKPFSELIKQQVEYHMTWSGRDVAHMLLRISFCFPKWVFNIINSIMFISLTLLIYLNVEKAKKHDVVSYGLIVLILWFFGISLDQTILWVSGSCNYLWTAVIVLGFITVYRLKLNNTDTVSSKREKTVTALLTTAMFLLGLLAGWSNENTSGGAILLVMLLMFDSIRTHRKNNSGWRLPIWSVAGLVGAFIGFIIMITAPGNRIRGEINIAEEQQTGVMALLGRLLKLNDAVIRNLGVLLVVIIVLLVYHFLRGVKTENLKYAILYLLVSFATVYALILTAIPMDRALFGAEIFIIIVCVQLIEYIPKDNLMLNTIKYSLIIVFSLYLVSDYLNCGADLYRIRRELNERQEYVNEQKAAGNYDLVLPRLREDWDNRFTFIYHYNDIDAEPDSYGNTIYELYYGLDSIRGIPWDEWEEMK